MNEARQASQGSRFVDLRATKKKGQRWQQHLVRVRGAFGPCCQWRFRIASNWQKVNRLPPGFHAILTQRTLVTWTQQCAQPLNQKVNPSNQKIIIVDLAVPNDCAESLQDFDEVDLITVNELKTIAEKNLKARNKEVEECKVIIKHQIEEYIQYEKQRELERAMQSVPASIKGIREKAFREVFAKEIDNLDPNARKIVDDVIDYMEKKYISVPMKMAKEILLKESVK